MSVFYTNASPPINTVIGFADTFDLVLSAFFIAGPQSGIAIQWLGQPRIDTSLRIKDTFRVYGDGGLDVNGSYAGDEQPEPESLGAPTPASVLEMNVKHHLRVAIHFAQSGGTFKLELDGRVIYDNPNCNTDGVNFLSDQPCQAILLAGNGTSNNAAIAWSDLSLGNSLSDLIVFPPTVPAMLQQFPVELAIGDDGPLGLRQFPVEIAIGDAGPVRLLQFPVEILYEPCPCVETYSSRVL